MNVTAMHALPSMKTTRPKTLVERQPYFFAYGAGISLFSPYANIYMISKLNPQVTATRTRMLRLAAMAFPLHTVLKAAVLNVATKVSWGLPGRQNCRGCFEVWGTLQGETQ